LQLYLDDAVIQAVGADGLQKASKIEWDGWAALITNLLLTSQFAGLGLIDDTLRSFLCIAFDNLPDLIPQTEVVRKQQLRAQGWTILKGEVHGQNECLADTLLQLLGYSGILPHFDVAERRKACFANRCHLQQHAKLEDAHRPQGFEYLQENIHAEPTIEFLLDWFRGRLLQAMPSAGVTLFVHSVWCGNAMVPTSTSRACVRDGGKGRPLAMHLYNTCSGRRVFISRGVVILRSSMYLGAPYIGPLYIGSLYVALFIGLLYWALYIDALAYRASIYRASTYRAPRYSVLIYRVSIYEALA
jgi:hypothetical protein